VLGKNNITIDGSNGTATIKGAIPNGNLLVVGDSRFGGTYGSAIALSTTANELDTSFTTTSDLGVTTGDYVRLTEGGLLNGRSPTDPTQCDPAGCRGEVLKVASVSGNTVTVTTALHDTYNPSVNAAKAMKLSNPTSGITVQNIVLDGSSTTWYGLAMNETMDSFVTGVTANNFLYTNMQGAGNWNLAWSNVTASGTGSPSTPGTGIIIWRQGNPSVNGMNISNLYPGPVTGSAGQFGLEVIDGVANGTFANVTIDATGADGRPWKSNGLRYTTWNSLTVKNGHGTANGMSLEFFSSHNTFKSCVVTNNGAGTGSGTGNAGINLFGDFNTFNTFSNCTVSGNGNVQVYDSPSYAVSPPVQDDANNTYVGNTIGGSATYGLLIYGANGCVNNNTFQSGLSVGIQNSGAGTVGSGNTMNGNSSNLTSAACSGNGGPMPPSGLTAAVQ
jgi:hypothetical protein